MNIKETIVAIPALLLMGLLPAVSSAGYILDSGTPTSTAGPLVLSTAQFVAGEFSITAGEVGGGQTYSPAAYLSAPTGPGAAGDTFTFDVYSNASFIGVRPSNRAAPVFTTTGTFSTTNGGWNFSSTDWTPTAAGTYWLALQVSSTAQTKGLDAPLETSAATGTAPALSFALAGSSGTYQASGDAIGLQIAPVPLPAAAWLLGSGVLGLRALARRRRAVTA